MAANDEHLLIEDGEAHLFGFVGSGVSHPGIKRSLNQDSFLMEWNRGLFIVSDGIGGHQAGELASKAVVQIFPRILEQYLSRINPKDKNGPLVAIRQSIIDLSQLIREKADENVETRGMGATLVSVWTNNPNGKVYLAWLGDSRIYLLRGNLFSRLTKDHTVVSILLENGEITPEQALNHPARGRLTRFVGMSGETIPDVGAFKLKPEDRLLLCSDGLHGIVPEKHIINILRSNPEPHTACLSLVEAANQAGGKDNITVIVLDRKVK